ncbi:hypothetical protein J3F83DRAFT_717193 [Trichoderma novae-zelandiae]
MPRRIFKNLVITTAGPLPGQLTTDNLRQWTALRKGTFTEDYDDQVTHLLCTREQFDRKLPRIKEALARGKKQHIVHCDWFEISAVSDKKQLEKEYSMRNILAKLNAAKREQARVERGKREGERAVNTNLFHIYTDRTFFNYQIDITRDDSETGDLGQRYTLYGDNRPSLSKDKQKPTLARINENYSGTSTNDLPRARLKGEVPAYLPG